VKQQNLHGLLWQAASFMVNKTSTIKRIYESGQKFAQSGDSMNGVHKCEVDVQMVCTRVQNQALYYSTGYRQNEGLYYISFYQAMAPKPV